MTLLLLILLASPADQLGFGSAGAAVGGAAMAEPQGATAAFYNPALAAARPGFEASLGWRYAAPRFSVNRIGQRLEAARAVDVGVLVPMTLASLGRFGASLAVSMPDQRLLLTKVVPTDRPRFLMYDNRLQRVSVDAGIAHARQFGEVEVGLGAGASVLTGAAGSGTTFYLRQGGTYSQADAAIDVELPVAMAPLVSVFVRWRDLSFGALYRGPLEFDLDVGIAAEINVGPLSGDLQTTLESVDFYTPAKIVLGAAWQHESLSLFTALELHHWSGAPPLTARWRTSVDFVGLPVEVPQGEPAAQTLRDVVVPRLGVEKRMALGELSLAIRAGAYVAPTPLRPHSSTILLDADRVGGSLGAGLTIADPLHILSEPVSLDMHVACETIRPRTFASSGPTDLRPDLTIRGFLLSGGAALTLRF